MATPNPKKDLQVKKVSGMMNFSEAVTELIAGKKLTRLDWQRINEYIVIREGFLCIHHHADKDDVFFRLMVSEGDITAKDWMIINE